MRTVSSAIEGRNACCYTHMDITQYTCYVCLTMLTAAWPTRVHSTLTHVSQNIGCLGNWISTPHIRKKWATSLKFLWPRRTCHNNNRSLVLYFLAINTISEVSTNSTNLPSTATETICLLLSSARTWQEKLLSTGSGDEEWLQVWWQWWWEWLHVLVLPSASCSCWTDDVCLTDGKKAVETLAGWVCPWHPEALYTLETL